jgi:hypothetical protein
VIKIGLDRIDKRLDVAWRDQLCSKRFDLGARAGQFAAHDVLHGFDQGVAIFETEFA